jgi:hypothetical protein
MSAKKGFKTFYVKKKDQDTYERFMRIVNANKWVVGDIIMEKVREVVALHSGGGSQTLMTYAENPRTLPLYKTCDHSGKELHNNEFYCKRITDWRGSQFCRNCRDHQIDGVKTKSEF